MSYVCVEVKFGGCGVALVFGGALQHQISLTKL